MNNIFFKRQLFNMLFTLIKKLFNHKNLRIKENDAIPNINKSHNLFIG